MSPSQLWHLKDKKMSKKKSDGFTFGEILVAMTVSILIIGGAYTVYRIAQKSYQITLKKADLVQNARIVLDRMSREIRQATEIATELPPIPDDPNNPPVSEIMFEDGHIEIIQYIIYSLEGTQMKRKIRAYYFGSSLPSSDGWVLHNAIDENGEPPNWEEIENHIIAENIK